MILNGCRRLLATAAKSPQNSRPSIQNAKIQLEKWLRLPNTWHKNVRTEVMQTLFQTYDIDPFAVNPAPFLERWRKENGHVESEAVSVYQKFRSHTSPHVASVLLRTRLHFANSAEEAVAAAAEFLSRHPGNMILYSVLLHRLTEYEDPGNIILKVLAELQKHKVEDAGGFNIALRFFCNDIDTVMKIVTMMKNMKVAPDALTYEQLVHAHLNCHSVEFAESIAWKIQDQGVLGRTTIQILDHYRKRVAIRALSITEKHQAIQAATKLCEKTMPRVSVESKGMIPVLAEQISHNLSVDRLLGILMDSYVYMGDTKQAKRIFEQLEHRSPDKIAIMIKASIQISDFETAQSFFRESPGIPQLNTFASACAETPGGLPHAIALFEEFPHIPDITCFNALLNCANHHDPNAAVGILESLPLPPDKVTYDHAMNTCYRLGQYERATHYLEAMKEAGFEPDSWTYVEILKLIDSPESKEQYLLENIPSPTVHCYFVVLQAWASAKKWAEMVKLLDLMQQKDIAFDYMTYFSAITNLSSSDQADFVNRADELLQQMQGDSNMQTTPPILYNHVMRGWCDLNDANHATKVLIRRIEASSEDKSLAPIEANFYQVSAAWIRIKQPKQAALLMLRFYDFVDQGILSTGPDENTRASVARVLVQEGKPEMRPIIALLEKRKKRLAPRFPRHGERRGAESL